MQWLALLAGAFFSRTKSPEILRGLGDDFEVVSVRMSSVERGVLFPTIIVLETHRVRPNSDKEFLRNKTHQFKDNTTGFLFAYLDIEVDTRTAC